MSNDTAVAEMYKAVLPVSVWHWFTAAPLLSSMRTTATCPCPAALVNGVFPRGLDSVPATAASITKLGTHYICVAGNLDLVMPEPREG